MAFQFRLQKVLKYRERLLELQTREVARANRVVEAIVEKLEELDQRIAEQHQAEATELNRTLSVENLMSRGQWIDHLENLREEIEEEEARARQELEAERQKLTAAWRDLEVLEQLRKKQKEAWEEEQRKRERQDLDELGQIRADRSRREKVS